MNANATNFDPRMQQQQQGDFNSTGRGSSAPQTSFSNPYTDHDSEYGGGYHGQPEYGHGMDSSTVEYYSNAGEDQNQYYQHSQQQEYGVSEWNQNGPQDPSLTAEPGSYYEVAPLQPHLYGAPVSAIAYDGGYAAMYVASVALSMPSSGRRLCHGASMLVTHSTTDGSLYASVAGHPEAPAKALTTIYDTVFGKPASQPAPAPAGANRRGVPSHAYKPPYGSTDPALPALSPKTYQLGSMSSKSYQLGITTLLAATEGYVASVSPSGVRLHAHGGLQVADYHVEGMLCATEHPNHGQDPSVLTHMTVAGAALGTQSNHHTNKQHIMCMDVWQGLRTVTSYSLDRRGAAGSSNSSSSSVAVTAMATSHSRGAIAVGSSDGYLRLLDSRLRELAKMKSHFGGVVDVAISDDGMLLATAGYGSRGASSRAAGDPLYCFPDPTIFVYDIRYLGRGGIPHPFAGLRGGPRHLSFMPDVDGQPSNRLLVASGQAGGGLQVVVPFEEEINSANSFILPQMDQGEYISAMRVSEENLALGTSQGNVLQYRLAGFEKKASSGLKSGGELFVPPGGGSGQSSPAAGVGRGGRFNRGSDQVKEKRQLVMPPFQPPVPPLSVDPTLLQTDDPNSRGGIGMNEQIKSIFTAYTLCRTPTVSAVGDPSNEAGSSFGSLATNPMVSPARMHVSSNLMSKATPAVALLQSLPTSKLELDLLEDHRPQHVKARINKKKDPLENPNKLLYTSKLNAIAYESGLNRRMQSTGKRNARSGKAGEDGATDDSGQVDIPKRYRLTLRPIHKSAGASNRTDYNRTGFLPGWDYSPTMPNAFVPPVLLLLYFIPEIRTAMLEGQYDDRTVQMSKSSDRNLVAELGCLFHRIESLSRTGLLFQDTSADVSRIEPWAPINFISCLTAMPEAEQLQILDGSPAAIDTPRRPEAFYRFILYQLDKEGEKSSTPKLMDSLGGIDFTSVNEFVSGSGPPSKSSTRALTIEFSYAPYADSKTVPSFSEVLRHTLCRETRLRAWNQTSKAYETIVQRKIATSLPTILSISCACAGLKEEEGLRLWRSGQGDGGHWLPEKVEIELEDSGNVIVRELVRNIETGTEEWTECKGSGFIPPSISQLVSKAKVGVGPRKRRYRLDAVISMVRDDLDKNCPDEVSHVGEGEAFGHHVLHARVSKHHKRELLTHQRDEIAKLVSSESTAEECLKMTLVGINASKDVFQKRLDFANQQLAEMDKETTKEEWVLVNGFVVSNTVIEDAKALHVKFKEPSLVVFRALDKQEDESGGSSIKKPAIYRDRLLTLDVMRTQSITNGSKSPCASPQRLKDLPGKGDLIAFDAEFVSVQEEESVLTDTGTKVTIRETRHALARISVIDCRTRDVVLDDHVIPREPVVDYLTRFSGIVAKDLIPKQSPHHLIGTRAAYLKLRFLMERGCIFIGHGLQQDFWTVNLAVPANQIIDTVAIYHKPSQRMVSLRFLSNFVLKRDMQQDVHDSVEDAIAAYDLYAKAVELKKKGEFEKLLDDLYDFGQKTDWKLGLDE
jgi:PAB-dependent poly(A)-specific ribonuclease subunit 2